MGVAFPHLRQLVLIENRFIGSVPISLSSASTLEGIFLPKNSFTGVHSARGDDLSFINSLVNCTLLPLTPYSTIGLLLFWMKLSY